MGGENEEHPPTQRGKSPWDAAHLYHRPALNPGGWGTEQERIQGASGKFQGPPSQTIVKAFTSIASST